MEIERLDLSDPQINLFETCFLTRKGNSTILDPLDASWQVDRQKPYFYAGERMGASTAMSPSELWENCLKLVAIVQPLLVVTKVGADAPQNLKPKTVIYQP
jgi:hypothetical protein